MAVGLEDIYRAIGELTARVNALSEDQKESAQEARDSRHKVANAAMATSAQLMTLEHRLKTVEDTVKRLEPFAEKADRWEQRGLGAIAAAGMIGSGATALLVYFKASILRIIGM